MKRTDQKHLRATLCLAALVWAVSFCASARAQDPDAMPDSDIPPYRLNDVMSGPLLNSYQLRLDPTLFLWAALPDHPPFSGPCSPESGEILNLSIVRDSHAAMYELYFPGTALSYAEIFSTLNSEGSVGPVSDSVVRSLSTVTNSESSGSGNVLNDALSGIIRSREVGSLHVLEVGSRPDGTPALILNGGDDVVPGRYVGGFEVPGVTRSEGTISFKNGFRLNHRQQFVAFTLPLDSGATFSILPGQSVHVAIDGSGNQGSTATEIGVAFEIPAREASRWRLQFTGGPEITIRPGHTSAVSVLPTVNGSMVLEY